VTPSRAEASAAIFETAEALEFRAKDFAGAAELFRRLATSADSTIRAASLMRLARVLRSSNQTEAALSAYAEMAGLGDVPVIGLPAELVGRAEQVSVLAQLGRAEDARPTSASLVQDLLDARWPLTRGQYDHYVEVAAHRAGLDSPPVRHTALAEVAETMWAEWHAQPVSAGRALRRGEDSALVTVWRWSPIAGPSRRPRFATLR
jgi:hypothetical protein